MEKIGYVYLTTNLVNGKQYVGQHLSDGFDKYYKGSGTYICNAFNKYGWDNFDCKIICWCSTQTQLDEAEDNYIKLLNTMYPNGYNLKGGGSHGRTHKETRKKLSEANKGKHLTKETKQKISETLSKVLKGHKVSEETRKKLSEANKGKHHTEETRKKISEAVKKRPKEIYKKVSAKLSGIPRTQDVKNKISEAHKGKTVSTETKNKISKKLKGIPNTALSKKVYQYTKDGKLVNVYVSRADAIRKTGFHSIGDALTRRAKTAGGYLWSYNPPTPPNNPS